MTAIATATATTVAGAAPMPRLRMTARGRRALALLVAAPVLAVGALTGAGLVGDAVAGAVASSSTATAEFDHITVVPGQSLWQIAQAVAPEADPRDVIAEIELLNGIAGAIQPGERLAIPAQYAD
ncbi:LysM peptidoglycan-binding domain-containing protein [Agrococcus sp. TF02-05]|uniref:LysM peptidoglycan-binding domain-containing protein n=1 Tax=Agrococcus sp. TF02-05 TaxID=2815211 RepID=UPI001AA10761|nr:LysM peptidoglycan-binding domain-containing protein [Agrococcus sp. TF02-05]MBO1769854.1 LysM peptidoglycan-binding domain-containing protein [Agrococcus sp. TF02-05]